MKTKTVTRTIAHIFDLAKGTNRDFKAMDDEMVRVVHNLSDKSFELELDCGEWFIITVTKKK